jgi:hypothetical protein
MSMNTNYKNKNNKNNNKYTKDSTAKMEVEQQEYKNITINGMKCYLPCFKHFAKKCTRGACPDGYAHVNFCTFHLANACSFGDTCRRDRAVAIDEANHIYSVKGFPIYYKPMTISQPQSPAPASPSKTDESKNAYADPSKLVTFVKPGTAPAPAAAPTQAARSASDSKIDRKTPSKTLDWANLDEDTINSNIYALRVHLLDRMQRLSKIKDLDKLDQDLDSVSDYLVRLSDLINGLIAEETFFKGWARELDGKTSS